MANLEKSLLFFTERPTFFRGETGKNPYFFSRDGREFLATPLIAINNFGREVVLLDQ